MNVEGFNHILLAYDGSKHSVAALKTAKQMSKLSGAHITVAFVQEPSSIETSVKAAGDTPRDNPRLYYTSTYVGAMPTPGVGVYNEAVDPHLQDNTPDLVISDAKIRISSTISTDYEILAGKPADELVKFAKEKDVDLIIMGNRGISGIKKLVTGSVSKKVVDEAECPVLVVK
jgi:nucleotide-binding universal stress UspA family protein